MSGAEASLCAWGSECPLPTDKKRNVRRAAPGAQQMAALENLVGEGCTAAF